MAALKYLAPQFLEEGRLYWLRSPLYIVTNGKKEDYYFNDDEFNAVRNNLTGHVIRCKGLGALNPDQAHNSMFTDKFQRLDRIEPSEEGMELLEQLMGDTPTFRTEFLFNKVDFSTLHE